MNDEKKKITRNRKKRVYRKCPWCEKELCTKFKKHIKNFHNKTIEDYIFIKYKINQIPMCPSCKIKKCSIKSDNTLNKTCGNKECHIFNSKNRVKDNNGKDVIAQKN